MTTRALIFIFGALPSLALSGFAVQLIHFSMGVSRLWWAVTWGVVGIVSCAPFWALTFGPPFGRLTKKVRDSYFALLGLGVLSTAPLLFSDAILALLAGSAVITAGWLMFILGGLSGIRKAP